MVDKLSREICRLTNDTMVKSLESMLFMTQRIVKGSGYFMWNLLLLTGEECVKSARAFYERAYVKNRYRL